MHNENVIAITIVLASIVLIVLGVDDGDYLKMVLSTYLGWMAAKRRHGRKDNEDNQETPK